MAYLKDLSVSKISFVNKAANKRKFILLKSGDEKINNNEGDIVKMRKELKDRLIAVCKSEKSPDKILEILKADVDLKLTEAEIGEVKDFAEVMASNIVETPPAPPTPPTNNADADTEKAALLKANQDLMARLEKIEVEQKRRDLISWLQKECEYLPDDIEKVADTVMQLESVSKDVADKYKDSLKKASAAVANSRLFSESGVSTDSLLRAEGDGFDLVRKVSRAFDEVRKSDKPLTSAAIKDIVNGFGSEYDNYRKSHTLRAKTN